MSEDTIETQPLVVFEPGDKVTVQGKGKGIVKQVMGEVLEVEIMTPTYYTVSKELVTRGN